MRIPHGDPHLPALPRCALSHEGWLRPFPSSFPLPSFPPPIPDAELRGSAAALRWGPSLRLPFLCSPDLRGALDDFVNI